MSYRIAGIDVHKKMLAVVVSDVEVDGEFQFERVRYSSSPEYLRRLAEWLIAQRVEEVVMESTAQYWKPVWGALERYWKPICQEGEGAGPRSGTLHLAQAQTLSTTSLPIFRRPSFSSWQHRTDCSSAFFATTHKALATQTAVQIP